MTFEDPVREGETAGYKLASYDFVPRGARQVLDVGCGAGEDVLALAERLGASTLVVGLDASLERIDEAQRAARNVALNVRFAVGDARSLPFPDGAFDLVRADGLLRATEERARVVRELVRVTAPGGRVVVHDDGDVVLQSRAPSPSDDDDLLALMRRAGLSGLEISEAVRPLAAKERVITVLGTKPLGPESSPHAAP